LEQQEERQASSIEVPGSRERSEWERRARQALNRWSNGGKEESVAAAIHEAFNDGVRLAAGFVEKDGHSELGLDLRRLADQG
jgi:hypothetical protein